MRLSNLKFKISGNNLFLISKMLTDKDTEGDASNPIYNYPVLKRYNLGISIDF